MTWSDTIAAISSAVGPAARMIVRLSGERAIEITESLAETSLISPAGRVRLGLSGLQIPAWIYLFRAPRSVTGENVAEINLSGNPLVARMTLDELVRRGARLAEPGEFTARAYFNGKLDLSQAEGVAAAIAAHSDAELNAARQLLAGELANRLKPIMAGIVQVLSLIEAGIDFVEEDINFISDAEARSQIQEIIAQLELLQQESARFEALTHTPRFVLVGRPNAGKSTLLNLLAGHQRAVVSPIAGTTRDVLSAEVPLRRGIIELSDAAGLEEFAPESPAASADHQIARDMHQRALRAVETADRVVLVRDLTDTRPDPSLPRQPDLVVYTKWDLAPPSEHPDLCISAITGEGVDELSKRLDDLAFGARGGGKIALNARHLKCIEESRESLTRAQNLIGHAGAELLALELRESLDAAGRILGEVTPDDVLGRIFSSFCIGK